MRVLNGTYTADLANHTGNYLLSLGVPVLEVGTADRTYAQTTIVVYGPKLYTLRYLISVFGIASSNQIVFKSDPSATVDIEVRLGNDWVGRLPAGF